MRQLVCLASLLVSTAAFPADESRPLPVLQGELALWVPPGFAVKAPDEDALPLAEGETSLFYDDPKGEATIAIGHGSMTLAPAELPVLEEATRMTYTYAKINSSGIRKIGGRDFAVIDAESPGEGDTMRFITAQTSYRGKLFLVSFACNVTREPGCRALGNRVIESIRLAD